MKKSILLASLLVTSGSAFSQNLLSVSDLSVDRKGDQVEISFRAFSAVKSFNVNNTYTLTPSIVKDENRYALSPIVLGGKRAKILNQRRGVSVEQFYHRGDTIHYRFAAPYAEWMSDGALSMEGVIAGCCKQEVIRPYFLVSHILPKPVEIPVVEPELPVVPVVLASVGKQLAEKYSFVAPVSDFEGNNGKPLLNLSLSLTQGKAQSATDQSLIDYYLSQNHGGALKLYFPVADFRIDPLFEGNAQSIKDLIEAVMAIINSNDSKVSHVVIAGFASPEGLLELNERLAWNRAVALKDFLSKSTGMDASQIYLFNGSENWIGLRKLVEQSSMEYRSEVLDIIKNVPVRQGRELKLMELAGGDPYRYMMKHFFPELRHAAYIKVYYDEKKTDK